MWPMYKVHKDPSSGPHLPSGMFEPGTPDPLPPAAPAAQSQSLRGRSTGGREQELLRPQCSAAVMRPGPGPPPNRGEQDRLSPLAPDSPAMQQWLLCSGLPLQLFSRRRRGPALRVPALCSPTASQTGSCPSPTFPRSKVAEPQGKKLGPDRGEGMALGER